MELCVFSSLVVPISTQLTQNMFLMFSAFSTTDLENALAGFLLLKSFLMLVALDLTICRCPLGESIIDMTNELQEILLRFTIQLFYLTVKLI